MKFVAFDSPEYKEMKREQRIHVCTGSVNAVAVHLVFDALGYVINQGSLSRSTAAARKLAHKLMEESDCKTLYPERHATITPITASQASLACNTGGMREHCKLLWKTALHHFDHMTRIRALIELANLKCQLKGGTN